MANLLLHHVHNEGVSFRQVLLENKEGIMFFMS